MPTPDMTAASPIAERRLALDDGQIRYRERPGDGPVVVLLHALSGSAAGWDDVIARLPAGVRAIAPDLRGRGGTRRPGGGGLAAHADDLARLLAALGVECPAIAGHSFGAVLAAHVACRWDDAITALVLVDGGTRPPDAALAAADGACARLQVTWPGRAACLAALRDTYAWRDAWSPRVAALLAGELEPVFGGWRVRGDAAVVRDDVAAMRALPARLDPRMRCPVTVVRASLGVLGPDDRVLGARELAALRADWHAAVLEVSGARHGSILCSHPAAVADACAAAIGFAVAGTDNDGSADAST